MAKRKAKKGKMKGKMAPPFMKKGPSEGDMPMKDTMPKKGKKKGRKPSTAKGRLEKAGATF